ncbi:Uncharacterised protein [Legionella beliardensis]|uniref:Uncharacterized protein n=1 Tax=Legionella beliardensis TaxID=91822 RepID=A0A378HZ11_9GAMM|nr:hypothetical protein [Legionella beliardensis]STX27982.1 Uncharacterised protein [Legionella beliardensis]
MLSKSEENLNTKQVRERFLFCNGLEGEISLDDFVGTAESKIGKVLISDGFGPCQAVLARLKNGEYAIYHALKMDCNKSFQNFVNSIKNNVEIVYVFQKSNPAINMRKGPYLAMNLARELNCKVKRINVDGYTGIYANADSSEVVLFQYPAYERNSKKTKIHLNEEQIKIINPELIGIKRTVFELYDNHQHDYKSCSKGVIVHNDVVIPEKFIPSGHGLFNSNYQDKDSNVESKKGHTSSNKNNKCTLL